MSTLDYQLVQLLDYSVSQHGFWIKNNVEAIREDLKSGIVRFGLKGMMQRLDDYKGKDCQYLYKKIDEARNQ